MRKILKWVFILAACLLLPASAFAQTTLVTATIVDPNGLPYSSGTIKAVLVDTASGIPVGSPTVTISSQAQCTAALAGTAPCQIPIQGTFQMTLDTTGSIPGGGMNLPDNSLVRPSGTQWLFTVIESPGIPPPAGTGPQSFSGSITISGATQSISAQLGAIAPALSIIAAPGSSSLVDPTTFSVPGAKFDARFFNDGSTTNTINTLTSATLNCNTADNGKLAIVVNGTTNVYPFGTGLVTQTGCNSSTVATLSTTASQTTASLNWTIGTDDTIPLTNAVNFAWTSGKSISLPCGVTILSGRPFVFSTPQTINQIFSLRGCGGGGAGSSTFILHPQVTSSILTGGTIFYSTPLSSPIGLVPQGNNNTSQVSGLFITSLGGKLPATSGTFSFIDAFSANNIQFQLFGLSISTSCYAVRSQTGEALFVRLNIQNMVGAGGCTGVYMAGQGASTLKDSIIAWNPTSAMACSAATICDLENDYFIGNGGNGNATVQTSTNSQVRVSGGTYTNTIATNPVFGLMGGASLFLDSTLVQNQSAGTLGGAVGMSSGTFLYMHKSTVNCTNATAQPVCIGGSGNAGTVYDLGGNTINGFPVGISLIADGHSVKGACTGVVTASSTLGLYGTGANVVATTCTSTIIGTGSVISGSRTLQNLLVTATAAGVNASSGIVTVLKNGGATTITCTIGTGTSCVDGTHTVSVVDGDLISIQFTTQAADTLAGVKAIVEWN